MAVTSKGPQGDALSGIGKALRKSIAVPTDTMITEDIPLLLTRLSTVPYGWVRPDPAAATMREPPATKPARD